MNERFALLPDRASSVASEIDWFFFTLVGISLVCATGICLAIVFLAIRYRKGAKVDRTDPPSSDLRLELLWSIIPLLVMLGIFVWSTRIFVHVRRPPKDAMELLVIGKQWMWKIQHPNGKKEINELHVPMGRKVKLTMSSEDVIHSFFIPAFRVKMDVLPGRYTTMWFEPTQAGEYNLFCAEYCGTGHSRMIGRVVVQTQSDYAAWVGGESTNDPPEVAGEKLFAKLRCDTCHQKTSAGRGPVLAGVFGRTVRLQGGRVASADENYLRESIVEPSAKVVEGYQNLMPTYTGQIGEEGLFHLIAYIKSLGAAPESQEAP